VTEVRRAKYPAIDVHCHARAKTPENVDQWVRIMDEADIETTVVFCNSGPAFDAFHRLYSRYPKRFAIWCGFNMADVDQPGFGPATIKELERCHKLGAVGVGEVTDKGMGIGGAIAGPPNWQGTRPPPGWRRLRPSGRSRQAGPASR
jgi:uncharacterized protein